MGVARGRQRDGLELPGDARQQPLHVDVERVVVDPAEHHADDGDRLVRDRVVGREEEAGAGLVERAGLDAPHAVEPEQLVAVVDLADAGHVVDAVPTIAATSGSARARAPRATRSVAVLVFGGDRPVGSTIVVEVEPVLGEPGGGGRHVGLRAAERPAARARRRSCWPTRSATTSSICRSVSVWPAVMGATLPSTAR